MLDIIDPDMSITRDPPEVDEEAVAERVRPRVDITPSNQNRLETASSVMVDRMTIVQRSKLGQLIGRLDDAVMHRIGNALLVVVGFDPL